MDTAPGRRCLLILSDTSLPSQLFYERHDSFKQQKAFQDKKKHCFRVSL